MFNRNRHRWWAAAALLLAAACGGRSALDASADVSAGSNATNGPNASSSSASSSSLSSSSSSMCVPDGAECEGSADCCDSACAHGTCGGVRCRPGDEPVVLAEGLLWPLGLVVDRDHVYFVDYDQQGAVFRAHKDGGSAEILAERSWPNDVAFDDDFLYFTRESGVERMRKDGSEATVLAGTFGGAGIGLRGADVVWAEYFGKNIKSVPAAGGSDVVLVPLGSSPFRLMVHQDRIYFTGIGFQLETLTDDGNVETVMNHKVRSLTAADGWLYVTVNEQSDHFAARQPVGGGAVERLMVADGFLEGIAVDDDALYVAGVNTISRVSPITGNNVTTLYDVPMKAGTIGVDESCVYITVRPTGGDDGEGQVVRLPKGG